MNTPRSRTWSRDGLTGFVLIVALVAMLVFGFQQARGVRENAQDRSSGEAALKAARSEVLALTTLSSTSTDADIARILRGATSGFRDQFEDQAKAFRSALVTSKVTSTGEIASAGLTRLKGDSAEVVVAAVGTVSNKDTPQAKPRNYRLRVDLERVGGRWLVSGMEFVA
jgi:hypothetical protein